MIAPFPYLRPAFVLLLLALAFVSNARAGDKPWPLAEATPLSPDAYYRVNCSARGLAGLHSPDDKSPVTWESTDEWREYQQKLDGQWRYLDRVRLNAMRSWSNAELSGLRSDSRIVFYPFSGPDVLYADTLFPHSKVLLMAGLEPVGTMPDLAQLQRDGRLGSYLAQVKTSLFTILAASFFKTKDMKTDFNNQLVDGLIPAIAVFLAREGYTIDSLRYVTLSRDGTVHPRGEASGAPGVQIACFRGDRDDMQCVLYFQADLGNDGLHENPGYVNLMHRLGPGITYLKAASYLLYEDYFSTIRNGILDNSLGVVEDDSGIPFRYFNPTQWNVVPYGHYTGPIPLFKEHDQADLADFYARSSPMPLTFGSGYKFTAANSSLIVAKKK
ncbi:MAG: hypothetical protein LV479_07835 [Methylacidiphilales bacterium]|nr:hypothetical protein [Candidatus Methylacidiphilales bacterium]